jgi:ribosome-associated protein
MIHITDTVAFDEREIGERFVRANGPGGLNEDRDATAVELRLDIPTSSLPQDVKERLMALGGRHVTTAGVLVVVARSDRSQLQNRAAAHARLLTLLERAAKPPARRRPTTLSAATRRKRLSDKQQHSAVKRSRSSRNDET